MKGADRRAKECNYACYKLCSLCLQLVYNLVSIILCTSQVRHSSTPLLGDPGSSSLPVIDPIGEDSSDKLTALARRFEEKYVSKSYCKKPAHSV